MRATTATSGWVPARRGWMPTAGQLRDTRHSLAIARSGACIGQAAESLARAQIVARPGAIG